VWQTLITFIIKLAVGVLFATFIEFKKNKMRQFDNLSATCQTAVLTDMVALAKAYESVHSTGDSIAQLAVDFGQTYLLTLADFNSINISQVTEWVGPMPNKPPRIQ
jgi:hypothetical protein